jgi:hypothetical protein
MANERAVTPGGDDTEIFTVADDDVREPEDTDPPYRIYKDSKIVVGKATGKMFQKKRDAALKAYETVHNIWNECYKYYRNDQTKTLTTPRGTFTRGDSTENVFFTNLNVMLPAVYSKDPEITCSTDDEADQPLCDAIEALVNALFQRPDGLKAKGKIKKATGIGLLTNQGVLKLDFTRKSDSREVAVAQLQELTQELEQVSTQEDIEEVYGKLEALERQMEVREPSGFRLGSMLPHNLLVDPYAENDDGTDGNWMMESTYISTASLNAQFTDEPEDENGDRKLAYKPSHKAIFDSTETGGEKDDGIGLVLKALEQGNVPDGHSETERLAYINMYYTKCWYVWDKVTRRLFLFADDDWKWPIWVWDDPYNLTRFYPYFLIAFVMSLAGSVAPGEYAYVLDQQDEINDINRQVARLRRAAFDYWFYNSELVNKDEVEKMVDAIRGNTMVSKHVLGIRAGERAISDLLEPFMPKIKEMEQLFDKSRIMDTINRVQNTNDALRGVQFKTNTNVPAVQAYQDALRLTVGAKVDVVEDVVADLAYAIGEIAIQYMDSDQVAAYIGPKKAEGWQQMDVATFRATYSVTLVAGSMEKPNSAFKKKEAIEVTQAIGQFAQAAPGATLTIMLRMLENAFTEINIKDEDWAMLQQEIQANLQRGNSMGPGAAQPGAPPQGGGQVDPQQLLQAAKQLPPEQKAKIMQMKASGTDEQTIIAYIQEQVRNLGNGAPQRTGTGPRQ